MPGHPLPLRLALLLLTALDVRAGSPAIEPQSVTADFAERDRMPQSPLPASDWYQPKMQGGWGPHAAHFPPLTPPAGVEPAAWKRARVFAVAQHYLGLPYQHHHIPGWTPPAAWTSKLGAPETPGLDCSNFTSWVYNYGLGVQFSSDIAEQSEGPKAPGRRLAPGEPYATGDLLFILQNDRARVSHVVIYIDDQHIIDEHGAGVAVRPFKGWYVSHLSHARRVIE